MKKTENYAVILAGGKGERFWPASTSKRPKQLLPLFGSKPLLVSALDRIRRFIPPERTFIVTGASLLRAMRNALRGRIPPANIIGEPVGRDTAAAIALGAALVAARDPEAVFCVLTADHAIEDSAAFLKTLSAAFSAARRCGALLTIGIKPSFPCTGYGYIELGGRVEKIRSLHVFRATRFTEKPPRRLAEKYIRSGRYLWNSGMFVWSVRAIAEQFRRHCPELFWLFRRAATAANSASALRRTLNRLYPQLQKISVDYAVMEKADNILVVKGEFGWADIGSWNALRSRLSGDAAGNVVAGNAELLDCRGNVVISRSGLVAMLGVKDLIVVKEKGVVMICHKRRDQDIKKLVASLAARGSYAHLL